MPSPVDNQISALERDIHLLGRNTEENLFKLQALLHERSELFRVELEILDRCQRLLRPIKQIDVPRYRCRACGHLLTHGSREGLCLGCHHEHLPEK